MLIQSLYVCLFLQHILTDRLYSLGAGSRVMRKMEKKTCPSRTYAYEFWLM